jgi:hypothetical protein
MDHRESPKYRYRVDRADTLVWVNSWWLAFARENGAAEITEQSVFGRSLWNFVDDPLTRKIYSELHGRIRATRKPVVLPFRCDSPSVRRDMRMTISPEDHGQLLYECVLVRAEPCRRLALFDTQQERADSFLTLCSCCKRALIEPAGWLDIEDAVARLGVFAQESVPQLRHTVCSRCADTLCRMPDDGDAA